MTYQWTYHVFWQIAATYLLTLTGFEAAQKVGHFHVVGGVGSGISPQKANEHSHTPVPNALENEGLVRGVAYVGACLFTQDKSTP